MGHDRAAADAVLALDFPLTVSVLPHLPLSTEVAEKAQRRGDQVMLHLPMESEADGAKPEDIELRVGMNAAQVDVSSGGNAGNGAARSRRKQPPGLARHCRSRVDASADARAAPARPVLHR